MARQKPVQAGVRVRLPKGTTWDQLAELTPEQIREKDLWPAGFSPCRTRTIPRRHSFSEV